MAELRRRKRLEANRKAAQESRRRKKEKVEELQLSVVFLSRENQDLKHQIARIRQTLAMHLASDSSMALRRMQAENMALKAALNDTMERLKKVSPMDASFAMHPAAPVVPMAAGGVPYAMQNQAASGRAPGHAYHGSEPLGDSILGMPGQTVHGSMRTMQVPNPGMMAAPSGAGIPAAPSRAPVTPVTAWAVHDGRHAASGGEFNAGRAPMANAMEGGTTELAYRRELAKPPAYYAP